MPYKKLSESATKTPKDSFIWEAFTKGQNWAFRQIFNDYYDALYYYGLRVISSEHEVKDLLQDFFLKLWSKRWKLRDVRNVKGYLFKSFRLLMIDYFRATGKRITNDQDNTKTINFSISHEQKIINSEKETELSEKLQIALNNLSPREKEAIYLRYYQNLEYKEVAKIMELKYQSVRNLIHSALQHLRKVI